MKIVAKIVNSFITDLKFEKQSNLENFRFLFDELDFKHFPSHASVIEVRIYF